VLLRLLRVEDVVLAGWSAVGVPLLAVSGAEQLLRFGGERSLPAGLIQLGAVIASALGIGWLTALAS
jgi:hypothetical protein